MSFRPHTGYTFSDWETEQGEEGPPGENGATGDVGYMGFQGTVEHYNLNAGHTTFAYESMTGTLYPKYTTTSGYLYWSRTKNVVVGNGSLPWMTMSAQTGPHEMQFLAPEPPAEDFINEKQGAGVVSMYTYPSSGRVETVPNSKMLNVKLDPPTAPTVSTATYSFAYALTPITGDTPSEMQSIQFDDAPSRSLTVTFTQALDLGYEYEGDRPVSEFFYATTPLGTDAYVSFPTPTTMQIFLGSDATVEVGDTLLFIGSNLSCSGVALSSFPFDSPAITAPDTPPTPSPKFVYQQQANNQFDQEFFGDQSDGLGGRDASWTWQIEGNPSFKTTIQNAMNGQSGTKNLTIDSDDGMWMTGNVSFSASVTNHFGESYTGTVATFTASDNSKVGIYLFPTTLSNARRYRDVKTVSWLRNPRPQYDNGDPVNPILPLHPALLTYTWRRIVGTFNMGLTSTTEKDLYIEGGLGTKSSTEQYELETEYADLPLAEYRNQADTYHYYYDVPPMSFVRGGNRFRYDISNPPLQTNWEVQPVIFQGETIIYNYRVTDPSGVTILNEDKYDDPVLDLLYNSQLSVGQYTLYVTMRDSANPSFTSVTSVTKIDCVSDAGFPKPYPIIHTGGVGRLMDEGNGYYCVSNHASDVKFECTDIDDLNGGHTYSYDWEITEGNLDLDANSILHTNKLSVTIPQGTLASNGRYTIKFTITDNNTAQTGYAYISFVNITKPTCGTAIMEKKMTNNGSTTNVFVKCKNWEDEEAYKPLRYHVYRCPEGENTDPDRTNWLPLMFGDLSHPTIPLDQSHVNYPSSGTYDICVDVMNILDGRSTYVIPSVTFPL